MGFIKGIGPLEIILILVVVMIIFGVGRLPEVGSGMGKGIREFRRQLKGGDDSEDTPDKPESEKKSA